MKEEILKNNNDNNKKAIIDNYIKNNDNQLSAHDLMKKIDTKIAELENDINRNGDSKLERKNINDSNEKISLEDVDKLLKDIDKKLEELDKEEKKQQEKLSNISVSNVKSVFQNYKIKEKN